MKPRLHPSRALATVLAVVFCFPTVWCQETVCGEPFQCGGMRLDYPFWGLDRPAYCGHPGFQLTCQSDAPILTYESVDYQLLQMDSSTQMITVARDDLWTTNCPQFLYNTTYNSTLFDQNNLGQQDVALFYGCNTSIAAIPLGSNYQFTCTMNGTRSDGFFSRTDQIDPGIANFLVQCENQIRVPVNRSSAERLLRSPSSNELRSALTAGFNLHWTANNDECQQCIRSNGRCGSNSTSPELFVCYCATGNFSLTCNNPNPNVVNRGSSRAVKWTLIIAFSCGVAGIMLLLFVMLCLKWRLWRIQKVTNHQIEMFIRNHGNLAPKRYKYSEIKKMTNSFTQRLGKGGYGSVYKGQLPDGQLVAVKLLAEAIGDGEDFINEVASISRTSHVNIVTLLGFCIEGKKRALMYEFMPNGSLDKFLRDDGSILDWNTLFLITKGIARGLEYLHRGCNTRIVHFDIKPHNILLDEEFVPKISDFGLAKLCKRKESIVPVTGARGTVGYIAPEVFFRSLGGASHKSDVYSFGIMVLEMAGASKHNNASTTSASEAYFPDQIYKQIETGDRLQLNGVTTKEEEELARKMVTVSLWCIQFDPSDRPSISKVVEMLEGSFESLQVPPRRFWSSPTMPAQVISLPATQSSSGERVLSVQGAAQDFSS